MLSLPSVIGMVRLTPNSEHFACAGISSEPSMVIFTLPSLNVNGLAEVTKLLNVPLVKALITSLYSTVFADSIACFAI